MIERFRNIIKQHPYRVGGILAGLPLADRLLNSSDKISFVKLVGETVAIAIGTLIILAKKSGRGDGFWWGRPPDPDFPLNPPPDSGGGLIPDFIPEEVIEQVGAIETKRTSDSISSRLAM